MTIERINLFFSNPYIRFGLLLLLIYLFLPTYLPSTSFLCEGESPNVNSCLDASWVTSLHLAIQKGLVFGSSYIFTYGPLGFLGTRTALGFSQYYLVISDLFIISNLGFILYYSLRKFSHFYTFFICLLIVYIMSGGVGMYSDQIVFTLLFIALFWMFYAIEYSNLSGFVIPIIITAFLFYIKVNISFVSLILFYAFLIYSIYSEKNKRLVKIFFGLSVPFLIFFLSFPLNTELIGYISGSLSLVDGYNDAMNLKLGEYNKYFVIALLVILTFCFSLFIKKENFKQNILLFFTFSISTFVLFKQSFVRSDLHVAIFFTFFPAICGLTILFYHKHSFTKLAIALLICLVCLVTEFSLISPPKFSDRLNYLRAVANPEDISERVAKDYDRFKLPQEVKNIIGDKTVDIIPWTINYIYFNNLNYNPRPIIQSYSVYTPYLMKLNRQKYDSETAPEFVIYSHTSIDWRYPLFDDQEAKLSLIQNYKCLGLYNTQNSDFLLFQRKPNLNKIVFSGQGEDTVKLGENYFLKDPNKSYFIKIGLDYTYLGKAVRFLYKPFPVSIVFTLEDNTERAYRAVLPIIKNGVLINPLIEEPKDFLNFVDGSPINTNKKIKAFRIEYESPSKSTRVMAPFTYVQEIKLSVSEFSFSKNEQ